MIIIKKRGQLWYLDLILALTIFTVMLLVAFNYISSNFALEGKQSTFLINEAQQFSNSLVTTGIPHNWTSETVISIGITTDQNKINNTKLQQFQDMSSANYDQTKYLLNLDFDFLIYFQDYQDQIINITNQTYIGHSTTIDQLTNQNPQNIITIVRYMVYSHQNISEIVKMNIVLWDDTI